LLPLAGACKGEDEEEPAMEPETRVGKPEKESCIAFPARSAEARHCTMDELRLQLDAWQTDQPTSPHQLMVSTLVEKSRQMISALEKELQEKAQQLGEKLVEVETLQGRVSQQHVEIERLKSKDPRLARSVCLAEFEAHKLLETCPFLRSFSSQTTESSTPHHAHTPAPHLMLAQRLEMLHTRGAPSSHSSSGIITSPQPTTQNFIQSGPVDTSKTPASAAGSIHDSHLQRFKRFRTDPPGKLGAAMPPPTAVPSMVSRWQNNDVWSARTGMFPGDESSHADPKDWPDWPKTGPAYRPRRFGPNWPRER